MSKQWEFTAEDFKDCGMYLYPDNEAAFRASRKLAEWLAAAPVVYGHSVDGHFAFDGSTPITHSARLICVEPIVKDTAEGLLRELLAERKEYGTLDSTWERANKWLARRQEIVNHALADFAAFTGRNPSDSECATERDDGA